MRRPFRPKEGGRQIDVAVAGGVALIGAAAVAIVLSGAVHLGSAAANDVPAAAPAAGPPIIQPTARVAARAIAALKPARPARHGPRTRLTHLPFAGVADGAAGVAIRLNGDPAPDTPRPTLSPAAGGTWADVGPYEVFHPTTTLDPCTSYTIHIPAGTFALHHRRLGHARSVAVGVSCPGTTAIQQALSRLGYLPYTLHGYVGASSLAPLTRAQAARRAFVPPPKGVLLPNLHGAPPLKMGTIDAATTGAMQVFEGDHGLPLSTTPSRQLWIDLLAAEVLGHRDPHPYTWVTVTESLPETLEVHEGARVALRTLTNTGVPGAATQQGIFPIYLRFVATTMIGTNVDGSHYDDPGVPWVNYFNGGDAVHGYIRPGYGYPQSNGCVELPIATAQVVYGMLQLGDLVIVE